MDVIKIGLDFGTHQTKICVQRIPDEGHGEPIYEFFQFSDYKGNKHYTIPSVIQINEDDTLSYGFVGNKRIKVKSELILENQEEPDVEFDIPSVAKDLYNKYSTSSTLPNDIKVLECMLQIHLNHIMEWNATTKEDIKKNHEELINERNKTTNVLRYFKQSSFCQHKWSKFNLISSDYACILYLAYILFLLENRFGTNFSINIGIPTDDISYSIKRKKAVEILASSYYLVEDVYKNDLEKFLKEKYDTLINKIIYRTYTKELKNEYLINVFPEAYASLIAQTSQGKVTEGMSLTVDIGGGTTDISFFTIEKGLPMIYKYWSIPIGLNYIAESSGVDYSVDELKSIFRKDVIDEYNTQKNDIVQDFVSLLKKIMQEKTSIPITRLTEALKKRPLVYSGGGSTLPSLITPVHTFSDLHITDSRIWTESNMKDKHDVSNMSVILTTAYGLSLINEDKEIELKNYSQLFNNLPRKDYFKY